MSCHGCEHNMANQLGHMDMGGCLYTVQTPSPPPSPALDPNSLSFTDYSSDPFIMDDIHEEEPVGCAVCATQVYFSGMNISVRRACGNTQRCQEHAGQCAYCRSDCEENSHSLLCERCSYSGAGNAAITEAFLQLPSLCLYDRSPNPSEGWDCGCSRCIQTVATFYSPTH